MLFVLLYGIFLYYNIFLNFFIILTHISNLLIHLFIIVIAYFSESKIQDYLSSKVNHYKLVTDQWIIDSIKAKKRLSETPYLTLNVLKVIIKS